MYKLYIVLHFLLQIELHTTIGAVIPRGEISNTNPKISTAHRLCASRPYATSNRVDNYLYATSPRAHSRLCRLCRNMLTTAFIAPAVGVRGAFHNGSMATVRRCVVRRRIRATVPPTTTAMSVASERPALQDVNEAVIRAVERLRGARVTASDVALTSGLGVDAATMELVRLAALTGAAVDVTEAGDIAYRFRDVRARLRKSSTRAAVRMAWEKAYPTIFTAVRIGFGVLLILSIIVTFVAIAALSAAASSRDDDRRDGGGGGGSFMPGFRMFTPNVFDLMYYSNYMNRQPSYEYGERERSEMSFLESVFSFVFGDGDPNADAEQRQWKAIAAVITANDGAVTAEQLRPFILDPQTVASDSTTLVDEGDVLPVLTRFGGRPEVTPTGEIVYVFPDFSTTGGATRRVEFAGSSVAHLAEREMPFSRATGSQRFWTIALGVVNVLGVVKLGSLLAVARAASPDAAATIALIKGVFPALAAYAAAFAVVPLIRYFWQKRNNAKRRERNRSRMRAAAVLAAPRANLQDKLAHASAYRVQRRLVRADDVVYSSDMDSTEVERRRQQELADDFDRRIEGR